MVDWRKKYLSTISQKEDSLDTLKALSSALEEFIKSKIDKEVAFVRSKQAFVLGQLRSYLKSGKKEFNSLVSKYGVKKTLFFHDNRRKKYTSVRDKGLKISNVMRRNPL